jgi:hypothetical protein
MSKFRIPLIIIFILLLNNPGYSAPVPMSSWMTLRSDAREDVKAMIRSEVDKREGFSSPDEEKANLNSVESEKERQDAGFKKAVAAANKEFVSAKKRRDDLTTQFQAVSTDLEEQQKNIKTVKTGIENLDSQAARYTQDIRTQQDALKKWLQMEKQGEALVAVIYTQGFKDTAHTLESQSDQASAPLMAEYMGTYVESFTKVVNSILSVDFIRTREEGTAKWNNEEPMRIELEKGDRGTTYLRLKRYELYPFQAPKGGRVKPESAPKNVQAAVITARKGLDDFLAKNGYSSAKYDLGRAYSMVQEATQMNATAADGLREQVRSFQSRISSLQQKITSNTAEKEMQLSLLRKKEEPYKMAAQDVAALQAKKEEADRAFQEAQKSLHDIRRVRDSIIVKTTLASPRGSQSPAEASAEVIMDKLAEVKNDAKTQHSSSTVEVTNFQLTAESSIQAVTEARITAVRLIAFINEGDSVRVKMAFRVRTVLEEPAEKDLGVTTQMAGKTPSVKTLFTPDAQSTKPADEGKKTAKVQEPATGAPAIAPPKRNPNALGSAEATEALFEVTSVKLSGDEITVLVDVTNLTEDSDRSVAIYDEAYRWTKSKLLDTAGNEYYVSQVVFWKGQQKTSMYDAGTRGVIMNAKGTQTAQLIFKKVPPDLKTIKTLTIHPFIYLRRTWREHDLVFQNIAVSR